MKCNENYSKAVLDDNLGWKKGYWDSVLDIFTAFLTIVLDWLDFNNLLGRCTGGGLTILRMQILKED